MTNENAVGKELREMGYKKFVLNKLLDGGVLAVVKSDSFTTGTGYFHFVGDKDHVSYGGISADQYGRMVQQDNDTRQEKRSRVRSRG